MFYIFYDILWPKVTIIKQSCRIKNKIPIALIALFLAFFAFPVSRVSAAVFAPGSCSELSSTDLGTEMSNQIDSRISGLATSTGNMAIYNARGTSTGVWTLNSSVWTSRGTSSLDFSGQSPWNTTGSYTRSGTLISPRHIVFANHYSINNGATVTFVDNSGNIVNRTLMNQTNIAGTDIKVGVLDSDVPPTIAYYPILSSDQLDLDLYYSYLTAKSVPMILMDQQDHVFVQDLVGITSGELNHDLPYGAQRQLFYELVITGDSGNPGFFAVDGQLILAFTHYTAVDGPYFGSYISQINAAMTSLGGGYQVSTYDLSCFTPYHTNPTMPTYSFAVDERSPAGTAIGTVTATGRPAVQSKSYSIISGNTGNTFAVNSSTGAITVSSTALLDNATHPTYSLVVQATDSWSPPSSVTSSVIINVKYVPPGMDFNLLHSFAGGANDGASPYGGLVAAGGKFYGVTSGGGTNGLGVVFSINADGSGFTVLHRFLGTASDGSFPEYESLLVTSTVIYGMTASGGASGAGIIYSMNTNGSGFTIIHSFAGGSGDGSTPYGSLIMSGTTLYGMTTYGGSSDMGVIFSIGASGSNFTILHTFVGGSNDGAAPYGSLTLFNSLLYGMTGGGGPNGYGTVFSMATSGSSYVVLHKFASGANDGSYPNGSLLITSSTVYGMTTAGGTSNFGTVFSMATSGSSYVVLHKFAGGNSDGKVPYGSLVNSGSLLYGMTYYGGSYDMGTIFSINTSGSSYSQMREFSGGTSDGKYPMGTLTLYNNSIYGLTLTGGNISGQSDYGVVFAFDFGTGGPTVTINAASSISTTTAYLSGTITVTGGSNATQSGFGYSLNSSLASGVTTSTLGAQSGTATFSSTIAGLVCNTQYYARAYATNASSTGLSPIISFRTSACPQPLAVAPSAPTAGTPTTSTLPLTLIDALNPSTSTTYAIYNVAAHTFVSSSGYASASLAWFASSSWISAGATIKGLAPNTSYSFIVLAANADGVATASSSASSVIYTSASTPFSLATAADSATQITLTWDGDAADYRAINISTGASSTDISQKSYSFSGLQCGTTYSFSVSGRNTNAALTTASALISGSTAACPTASPSGGGGGGGGGGGAAPAASVPAKSTAAASTGSGVAMASTSVAPKAESGIVVKVDDINRPAVYYVEAGFKYLFVNRATYSVWSSDIGDASNNFSVLKKISQDDFDKLPFGSNIAAKPGSLIKFDNSPKAYAVGSGAKLYELADAAAQKALFGAWTPYVIQTAFRDNYYDHGNAVGVLTATSKKPD